MVIKLRYHHMTASTFQQSKFQVMSDSIIGRIDEMGVRLDELERNVGELMHQSGIEDPNH